MYFLKYVIEPSLITDDGSFIELLNVMEDSECWNIKKLAQQIRSKLKEGPVNTDNTTG